MVCLLMCQVRHTLFALLFYNFVTESLNEVSLAISLGAFFFHSQELVSSCYREKVMRIDRASLIS